MTRASRQLGLALVVLGAILLFARLTDIRLGEIGWPFFIIVPGLILLAAAFNGRSSAGLAVPGSIVTMVGLINLVQAATNSFETWAYAWALIIAAAGAGQYLQGRISGSEDLREGGIRTAWAGLLLFACFGIFFELFIFGGLGASWLGRYLLPVLLVIAGVVLLWRQGSSRDATPERE